MLTGGRTSQAFSFLRTTVNIYSHQSQEKCCQEHSANAVRVTFINSGLLAQRKLLLLAFVHRLAMVEKTVRTLLCYQKPRPALVHISSK